MSWMDRDQLVCIGCIAAAYGLEGGLRVLPLTASPHYYLKLASLIVDDGSSLQTFKLKQARLHANQWRMWLHGIHNRQQAQALKGAQLLLPPQQLKPLEPDEYFQHDLIGCRVTDQHNHPIGQVQSLLSSPHHQVLEIARPDAPPLLAPFTKEVFPQVNLKERCLTLHPLPEMDVPHTKLPRRSLASASPLNLQQSSKD